MKILVILIINHKSSPQKTVPQNWFIIVWQYPQVTSRPHLPYKFMPWHFNRRRSERKIHCTSLIGNRTVNHIFTASVWVRGCIEVSYDRVEEGGGDLGEGAAGIEEDRLAFGIAGVKGVGFGGLGGFGYAHRFHVNPVAHRLVWSLCSWDDWALFESTSVFHCVNATENYCARRRINTPQI